MLHQHFLQSEVRTHDPEQAQLFFIPMYLGRHYNWFWQQWSAPGNAWDVHAECLPEHTPSECFWDKWTRAKEARIWPQMQMLIILGFTLHAWNDSRLLPRPSG